jgi:hypothetical protein
VRIAPLGKSERRNTLRYSALRADQLVGEETQDSEKEDDVMAEAAGSTVVVFGNRDRACVEHVLK